LYRTNPAYSSSKFSGLKIEMNTSAITFDQLESSTDTTLAWVLWGKRANNMLWAAILLVIVRTTLARLVRGLTADRLNTLSTEQVGELKKSLQELHAHLVYMLRHRNCDDLKSSSLFRSSICSLTESTEDLGDIIEDLALASNPQFNTLVSDCVQALSHSAVGSVGRM
jgi:hypothetical protein